LRPHIFICVGLGYLPQYFFLSLPSSRKNDGLAVLASGDIRAGNQLASPDLYSHLSSKNSSHLHFSLMSSFPNHCHEGIGVFFVENCRPIKKYY
jgi:hypothetical protein